MSILTVRHRTTFTYDEPASGSFNEVRMRPVSTPDQTVLESDIAITPLTWSFPFVDYFGTQAMTFEVRRPHSTLEILATARVEVHGPRPRRAEPAWDELRGARTVDLFAEYLAPTGFTMPNDALRELAARFADVGSPQETVDAVMAAVFSEMNYVPGSTAVTTSAGEAWEARNGVCQDMAHVAIAVLRELGIPTRYVSGYLHPEPEAPLGSSVAGQSHAWLQWWGGQWFGYDPTNAGAIGEGHVLVAHGRDYSDVAPLRGVVVGRQRASLAVAVELVREQ